MRNIDSKIVSPGFDYCAPVACHRVLQQNRHGTDQARCPPLSSRYRGVSGLIADMLRPPSLTDGVDKVDEATALAPAELLMGFRLIDPPPPGRCVWNCDLDYAGSMFFAFGCGR